MSIKNGYLDFINYGDQKWYWEERLEEECFEDELLASVLSEFVKQQPWKKDVSYDMLNDVFDAWVENLAELTVSENSYQYAAFRLDSERAWSDIIGRYFSTAFTNCDYGMMHFFSQNVCLNRVREFLKEHDYFEDDEEYMEYYGCDRETEIDYDVMRTIGHYDAIIPYYTIIDYINAKVDGEYEPYAKANMDVVRKRWLEGYREPAFRLVVDFKSMMWKSEAVRQNLNPHTLYGRNFKRYLKEATDYYGRKS